MTGQAGAVSWVIGQSLAPRRRFAYQAVRAKTLYDEKIGMLDKSLSSLSIGRHQLSGRAFLAPMSGVTDHGFRLEAERFGASLVVSEMVAADELAAGSEEARLRAEGDGIALHVVQLAGCEPQPMAEGARVAEASGGQSSIM